MSNDIRGNLTRICKNLSNYDANEAETRIKLIDRILYELLEWSHDDISNEERVSEDGNTKFADYIVRTANTAFLIEAKRIGKKFENLPSKRKSNLSGNIMLGNSGDAIIQARDYCRKKSIPYAVITNGTQWIIFPAIRVDQIEFSSSCAIIFDSPECFLGNEYDHFYSLLSRNGVIDGNLELDLIGRNADQIEERRLKAFFKSTSTVPANPIYPLIENAIVTSFTDSIVDGDINILDKCYVKTPDRTKFDNRIKMHLLKREPLFSSQPKNPMNKREADCLIEALTNTTKEHRPLAILILGTVGAGKTTFIKYTRKIATKDFFEKRFDRNYPHWIEIDFRCFSQGQEELDFIINNIFDYMKEDSFFNEYKRSIESAYKKDIEALKKGPMFLVAQDEKYFNIEIATLIKKEYEQVKPYVEKLLKYACTKVPVFLVIDNVDQFEDENIQSKIFSKAIAFAHSIGLSLVIAMRESTYIKHRHSATFDAFDFDPIQLEPPEIKSVLSRRFFIAENLLKNKSGEFTANNGARFNVEDLSIFIKLLQGSVLGTEVGNKIDILANRDVRLALRMTREFLERGYTDPAKAIRLYKRNQTYTLPKHEAFRAILLGNQSVYSEEFSVIGNPFDARLEKTNSQLLRLFILTALVKISSEKASEYTDGELIRKHLRNIGFSDDHILRSLSDLCKLKFINTASHGHADFKSNYYTSRLGGYVIRDLLADFTFIENVMMDTFISSQCTWDELKALSSQIKEERNIVSKIEIRVNRAKIFYQYLLNLYQPIIEESQRRGLPFEWCTNPLLEMQNDLNKNCQTVLSSAKHNYGNE